MRFLDSPLINCEIQLNLSWSRYCVVSENQEYSKNSPAQQMLTTATGAISQINNAKLYVPVVTLSFNYNIKF